MKKLKKLFLVTAVVVIALLCLVISASAFTPAETGQCGENVYWTYDGESDTLTISGTGPMYDYEYKEFRDGPIDQDGCTSPFFFTGEVNSIVIEEGVTTVGAYAFWFWYDIKLESITLPDSIVSINKYAFYGCENVTDFVIPDGVTYIGSLAFAYCRGMDFINIPASVTEISPSAFYFCNGVTVDEYNTVYSADEYGVLFNKDKTELVAFPQDRTLENYTIPDTVKTIGKSAFSEAIYLHSVSIPEGVTTLEDFAFSTCYSFEDITLPESLTYIGDYAFQSCYKILYLYIPENVSHIGTKLFNNCDNLIAVTVDEGNQYYTSDSAGALYTKDYTMLLAYPKDNVIKNYIIPDGVESICEYAFYMSGNLESVAIPSSVTTIGKSAFYGTSATKYLYKGTKEQFAKIEIDEKNKYLTDKYYADCIFYDYNPDKLGRPEYVNATASSNAVKLEWKRVPDAYGYRIYVKTDDGWKALWNTTCDYYTEGGLEPLTEYTFAVRAGKKVDGKTVLADSYTTVTVKTKPAEPPAPEKITVIPGNKEVTLTWNPCEGATGYRIYKKEARYSSWASSTTYEWVVVASSVTTTSYTIKNLLPGQQECYAVRPYNKTGNEVTWGKYTEIYASPIPGTITEVTAEQNTSAIKLTWKSARAEGYRIYYKSGNQWKVAVSSANGLSHTFTGLKPGAKYTFAIRPYWEYDGKYYWADYTEFTTATKPEAVTAKVTSPSKGKLTLTWNAVSGAEGYQVFYKTGNGSYQYYNTYTNVKNLTFTGLKSGTKYTFAVRAGIRTDGGNIFGGYKEIPVTVK